MASEGYVSFRGYRTWYRVVGEEEDEGKHPVLLLHGGPGGTHDYLEPLEALAETGRRAVFYDQLGRGKSDLPEDESLWVVDTFVEELRVVRRELGTCASGISPIGSARSPSRHSSSAASTTKRLLRSTAPSRRGFRARNR